tara:strand:+ start:352 stop:1179 length:828 start_codon:yes stop_codon:yes gene_type:complete
MNLKDLKQFSTKIRKNILLAAFSAGAKSAHIGGALSISDIIAVLYGKVMKFNSNNPLDENRDRLILSKGHACLALYSALAEKKFFPKSELENFEKSGSFLLGHPVMNKEKGIEFSTGSLGMGVSLGIGVALAAKRKNKNFHTYIIVGDGECNEGSIWESALYAAHAKLDNLTVIIDKNNLQQTGKNQDILNLDNLIDKFKSFNWHTIEIDGHNIESINNTLTINTTNNKPKAIIANTVKGKGVSLFENNNEWHHSILVKNNYEIALKELDEYEKK